MRNVKQMEWHYYTKEWANRNKSRGIKIECGYCGRTIRTGERVFKHNNYPQNKGLNHASCMEKDIKKLLRQEKK